MIVVLARKIWPSASPRTWKKRYYHFAQLELLCGGSYGSVLCCTFLSDHFLVFMHFLVMIRSEKVSVLQKGVEIFILANYRKSLHKLSTNKSLQIKVHMNRGTSGTLAICLFLNAI